jgi:hypothetical protein
VHPLVFHLANSVHSQSVLALLQEHRAQGDPGLEGLFIDVGEVKFAHVIDEANDLKEIERTESTIRARAPGVIMVAVDGKDKGGNVQVRVVIVDAGEGKRGVLPSRGSPRVCSRTRVMVR